MSRTFRGIAHQTPFSRDVLINTSITSQTTNWEIEEEKIIQWLQTQT